MNFVVPLLLLLPKGLAETNIATSAGSVVLRVEFNGIYIFRIFKWVTNHIMVEIEDIIS